MDVAEAVAVLKSTPPGLQAFLGGLPEAWTTYSPAPGSWSPLQIVGHLVHGEETDWVPRMKTIFEHGPSKTFEPFDREGMAAKSSQPMSQLLDEFSARRAESIAEIEKHVVSARDLDREGTHPQFGQVTLGQLLATWAVHDLGHVAQITEAMAKRYRSDIGPWRRYLPVVDRPDTVGD